MSMHLLKRVLLALALIAAGIQFIQPDRTNPPSDPAGSFEALVRPSPQAAAIIRRACQNCHSNRMRGICKEVKEGDMPLWQYRLLHSESKLTAGDVSALCALAGPIVARP